MAFLTMLQLQTLWNCPIEKSIFRKQFMHVEFFSSTCLESIFAKWLSWEATKPFHDSVLSLKTLQKFPKTVSAFQLFLLTLEVY